MDYDKLIDDFLRDTKLSDAFETISVGYGLPNIQTPENRNPGIVVMFFDKTEMNSMVLPATYKGYPVYTKLSGKIIAY